VTFIHSFGGRWPLPTSNSIPLKGEGLRLLSEHSSTWRALCDSKAHNTGTAVAEISTSCSSYSQY